MNELASCHKGPRDSKVKFEILLVSIMCICVVFLCEKVL
jgi:hypothetical protein